MNKVLVVLTIVFFSKALIAQEQDTSFTLCDDKWSLPYYRPELTYNGSFWVIKEHFYFSYPQNKFSVLKNNTGIITVQFKVNCKGETGDFTTQMCDLNYKETNLHPIIIDYFLSKTKTLKDWIPAKDEEGKTVNSNKFFSFRIKDGVLIEILPK